MKKVNEKDTCIKRQKRNEYSTAYEKDEIINRNRLNEYLVSAKAWNVKMIKKLKSHNIEMHNAWEDIGRTQKRILVFRYSYRTQFSREEGKVGRYAPVPVQVLSQTPSELLARGICEV